MEKILNICKDFSKFPAGRFRNDGPYNAELFREDLLVPAFNQSTRLIVELDGTAGYSSSFLEEAFGGLVRSRIASKSEILERLVLITTSPTLAKEIKLFIDRA